ncbi:putative DNA glycosylase [Lyophyllum shimeji]|uniref:DNA glycosylase n=1 Tax=Lyophyllum shimeji TaxID=47721 RepID=A0A9P3UKD4_LYOSH|nr:putative DNA glycosylase [Lyophyllum shimeji]
MASTPRRTKTANRAVTLSPYFSRAGYIAPHTTALQSDSGFVSDDGDDDDSFDSELFPCDPLFCYYFRSFLVLYRQLAVLKPALMQERVSDDPWKLLVAVTLLNKTSGRLAILVFWKIIGKWATPWALSQADTAELTAIIQSLGTQNIRARRLINLSKRYLEDPPRLPDLRPSTPRAPSSCCPPKRDRYPPTPISHLPGAGPYALDSYRIFCTVGHPSTAEEWKIVMPSDKELIRYLRWKWAFIERKEWAPMLGVIRPVTLAYLKSLVSELNINL